MKILTGVHREAYESLVAQNARMIAQLEALENEIRKAFDREKAWEERWRHANARAERAIDAQLSVRGFPTVTPREGMPTMPDELSEDPEQVEAMEKRLLAGDASVFQERL